VETPVQQNNTIMSQHEYIHINLSYLYEIADNETGFVREMINDYVSKLPEQFNELKAVSGSRDFKQTGFIAHKLKSSFQFMGADTLTEYVHDIELMSKKPDPDHETIAQKITEMIPVVDQVLEELRHKLSTL
jgi:HPt (histidine-containing phosphotransfer) domain-containing protein